MALNQRQRHILQWIADGTPERDWPDWTHRATAKALQARGLVRVRGHGVGWTASITERGQRVLDGDEAEPERSGARGSRTPASVRGKTLRPANAESAGTSQSAPLQIDPADLMADLAAARDQVLRIPDPDPATRASFRRALATIPADLVPSGKRVTHTGRDHGDLVIRLVARPAPAPPHPAVTVPTVLDPDDPLLAWLIRHLDHVDVAEGSQDRALRIIQGVVAALRQRGHEVSQPPPRPHAPESDDRSAGGRSGSSREHAAPSPHLPTFAVTVGDQVLEVDLYEEQEKVDIVPAEAAAKLKYQWQRVSPVEAWQFNGRLWLRIRGYSPRQGSADRTRWTLESRLPRFITAIEDLARARSADRQRVEEARQRRHQQWEEALREARAAYLGNLNRGRLEKQVELYDRAGQLRAYADAVAERVAGLAEQERASAEAWVAWISAEADRHDPTLREGNFAFVEPVEISHWDLDKYMPRGLTSARPPD